MTKQQHYPPTCPVCGASLPHDNPMSREYHEQVIHRSSEEGQHMSPEEQIAWCSRHQAAIQFHSRRDVSINVSAIRWTIWAESLEAAIKKAEEVLKGAGKL